MTLHLVTIRHKRTGEVRTYEVAAGTPALAEYLATHQRGIDAAEWVTVPVRDTACASAV